MTSVGYISGAFDILHIEHVDQLRLAREQCDYLFVGVLSDEIVATQTGAEPVNPYLERLEIVRAMSSVDAAIGQLTPDLQEVWRQIQFDVLFVAPHGPVAAVDPVPKQLHDVIDVVQLPLARRTESPLHGPR